MTDPSGVITFTSDFGLEDHYVGVVKGVILKILPSARIVDLTHQIPAQDVEWAAWTLKDSVPFFGKGTVHLAVVDPGVGTSRRPIAIEKDGNIFVGPDNGLFSFFLPADKAVALDRKKFFLDNLSSTFHGRDVFAPVAARIASGLRLSDLGSPVSDPVKLEIPEPEVAGQTVMGRVVQIDRFGNLITNVPRDSIQPERVKITIANETIEGLKTCYGMGQAGLLIALIGSSGRLEISVMNGSTAKRLGVVKGALVKIEQLI